MRQYVMPRAFFIGAGASRADGFPLTREISYGVAAALTGKKARRYGSLSRFLKTVFAVTPTEVRRGAKAWDAFVKSPSVFAPENVRLPDIVELLSLLDVIVSDESFIAAEADDEGRKTALGSRGLSRVREQASRAVAACISSLAEHRLNDKAVTVSYTFVKLLRPHDVVITTNWDLLLDSAFDTVAGTSPRDVGSDVLITDKLGKPIAKPIAVARAPLFKLHGSLNWLVCFRCTRLYVNPSVYIADLGFSRKASGPTNTCHCGLPLRAMLITPTFFKQYRNRHLANIWATAQERLANCAEWHFIGYSLPPDDVHIRAFLLRAFHMRKDAGLRQPTIKIVTTNPDSSLRARYECLFGKVTVKNDGFAGLVRRMS